MAIRARREGTRQESAFVGVEVASLLKKLVGVREVVGHPFTEHVELAQVLAGRCALRVASLLKEGRRRLLVRRDARSIPVEDGELAAGGKITSVAGALVQRKAKSLVLLQFVSTLAQEPCVPTAREEPAVTCLQVGRESTGRILGCVVADVGVVSETEAAHCVPRVTLRLRERGILATLGDIRAARERARVHGLARRGGARDRRERAAGLGCPAAGERCEEGDEGEDAREPRLAALWNRSADGGR